ncbi:immune inhibitor A [Arthrobacter tecti]
MEIPFRRGALIGVAAALALSGLAVPGMAQPPSPDELQKLEQHGQHGQEPHGHAHGSDDKAGKLDRKQREVREEAVDKLINGEATTEIRGGERVIKVPGDAGAGIQRKRADQDSKDSYVRYPEKRTENLFVIPAEFGDEIHPQAGGQPGPLHNQMPKPDRDFDGSPTDNNKSHWVEDFSQEHYQEVFFGEDHSLSDYFDKVSNGRLRVGGEVADWVQVPYNRERYQSSKLDSDDRVAALIDDSTQAWYEQQQASGMDKDEIVDYLAKYDLIDDNDHDGDGVFNEPDGYIDHFAQLYAGNDSLGAWYSHANFDDIGVTGPEGNKLGGVEIGDSGIWVEDYFIAPELGISVYPHEFGHSLGLPDLYGGRNSNQNWSLMAQGVWVAHETDPSVGTGLVGMGAWEKLQMGWLDYQQVEHGEETDLKIGPADRDHENLPQALLVNLPDKKVTTRYNRPHSGGTEWWSGAGNNLSNTLSRTVDLTSATSSASVAGWLFNDLEADWDFLYAEASTDGGQTWEQIGEPIDGTFGWTEMSWDLTKWLGSEVTFRFRMQTDGAVTEDGSFLDDLSVIIDGETIFSDDVESGDNGWTADGWKQIDGTNTESHSHYYLAENRVYHGYDETLRFGTYYSPDPERPNWRETFPYQNGMLVWYVNNEYNSFDTSKHPGYGKVMVIDSRPAPLTWPDGSHLPANAQAFDATFGREFTDPIDFRKGDSRLALRRQPGIATFADLRSHAYWDPANPQASVKTPFSGTTITANGRGDVLNLKVGFEEVTEDPDKDANKPDGPTVENAIEQSTMSVHDFSSQEIAGENAAATNAIDGNPSSFWHTQWQAAQPVYPHHITLDLGAEYEVTGFEYRQRQSETNGRIADYEILVSTDGITWSAPVASGTFENTAAAQVIDLVPTEARYVRLTGLNAINGSAFAGASEIYIGGIPVNQE